MRELVFAIVGAVLLIGLGLGMTSQADASWTNETTMAHNQRTSPTDAQPTDAQPSEAAPVTGELLEASAEGGR